MFGLTCGSAACFLVARGPWVRPAPGLPCALSLEGGDEFQSSDARCVARTRSYVWMDLTNTLAVIQGRAKHELRCAIAHRRIHTPGQMLLERDEATDVLHMAARGYGFRARPAASRNDDAEKGAVPMSPPLSAPGRRPAAGGLARSVAPA